MSDSTPPSRDIFREAYDTEHIPGIISELKGTSDRTVAIILASTGHYQHLVATYASHMRWI